MKETWKDKRKIIIQKSQEASNSPGTTRAALKKLKMLKADELKKKLEDEDEFETGQESTLVTGRN